MPPVGNIWNKRKFILFFFILHVVLSWVSETHEIKYKLQLYLQKHLSHFSKTMNTQKEPFYGETCDFPNTLSFII